MQNKDFVVGKKPNYYQINSKFQDYTDHTKNHNRSNTCDNERRWLQQTVRPKSYWKLKRPAIESKSQQEDRIKLWELKTKGRRFNEQTIDYNETIPKIKPNNKIKEKEIIGEIVKGLEVMNEEGLASMYTYMRFIQEEQHTGETLNDSNLKKLQVSDLTLRREDMEVKSHTSTKSRDSITLKVANT